MRHRAGAMSKISPSLKALINASFAHPGPTAAPAAQIREAFVDIARDASRRQLGPRSWIVLSAAATFTLNSPDSLTILHDVASSPATTTPIPATPSRLQSSSARSASSASASTASPAPSTASTPSTPPPRLRHRPPRHRTLPGRFPRVPPAGPAARPRPLEVHLPPAGREALPQAGALAPRPAGAHPRRQLRPSAGGSAQD
uniref:Uncharacterized protein n=1 Tax=Bionectria ochroleuca TaxID=29856 RepID=A0A8H7K856_BIOOC